MRVLARYKHSSCRIQRPGSSASTQGLVSLKPRKPSIWNRRQTILRDCCSRVPPVVRVGLVRESPRSLRRRRGSDHKHTVVGAGSDHRARVNAGGVREVLTHKINRDPAKKPLPPCLTDINKIDLGWRVALDRRIDARGRLVLPRPDAEPLDLRVRPLPQRRRGVDARRPP